MVLIIVVALVITQLISFYLIILLNSKMAKFQDLEIRQTQLMRQMDDSMSLYLVEMKQENDRLVAELAAMQLPKELSQQAVRIEESSPSPREQLDFEEQTPSSTEVVEVTKTYVPKNVAARAYSKQTAVAELAPPLAPFEQQVVDLHRNGLSIEEIAKTTQKGKTEIELLLKFHT